MASPDRGLTAREPPDGGWLMTMVTAEEPESERDGALSYDAVSVNV